MSVGEFKANFSEVIEQVKTGEEVTVTFGKRKKVIGIFAPKHSSKKKQRKLGILQGKAKAVFHSNFKITEEEFLGI